MFALTDFSLNHAEDRDTGALWFFTNDHDDSPVSRVVLMSQMCFLQLLCHDSSVNLHVVMFECLHKHNCCGVGVFGVTGTAVKRVSFIASHIACWILLEELRVHHCDSLARRADTAIFEQCEVVVHVSI